MMTLQDELLHELSQDGGEADRPVVPRVLLALFEDWSDKIITQTEISLGPRRQCFFFGGKSVTGTVRADKQSRPCTSSGRLGDGSCGAPRARPSLPRADPRTQADEHNRPAEGGWVQPRAQEMS